MTQPKYTPVVPLDFLLARIDASGDCWEWTGSLAPNGYGVVTVKIKGKWFNRGAHRVVWTTLCGPIPGNLPLDHLCRVHACVNPDHLEPVSAAVNIRRGMSPAVISARRNACHRGHAYTPQNLYIEMNGKRHCRTCQQIRDMARPKRWKTEHGLGHAGKTVCPRGHQLAGENLYVFPSGGRTCRICKRVASREAYRRKREGND